MRVTSDMPTNIASRRRRRQEVRTAKLCFGDHQPALKSSIGRLLAVPEYGWVLGNKLRFLALRDDAQEQNGGQERSVRSDRGNVACQRAASEWLCAKAVCPC